MLNIHSKFSLRFGIKNIDWIIDWSSASGYRRVALTDINNTSGVLSFIQRTKNTDLHPVVGVDIRNGITQCYIILARNNRGFHEMNSFLSRHLHHDEAFKATPDFLPNCFIVYPFGKEPADLRSNEFVGISPKQVNLLRIHPFKQPERLVALHSMTFENKRDFNAHRLLRSIDKNCLLSKLPAQEQANADDRFLTRKALTDNYSDFPDILTQTENVLNECNVSFEFGEQADNQNLQTYTGNKQEDRSLIEKLCQQGIPKRYPAVTS